MVGAHLDELPYDACLELLREQAVGRVAFLVDDAPVIVPVNYRLAEIVGRTWIAVRTRPGNTLERAPIMVAFEIDGIDTAHHRGWSVLVRGTLHHLSGDVSELREHFDTHPWLDTERDAWLVIEPFSVTGRVLQPAEHEWAFHARAYL
jgi:nitroimidazol reductase NimA-like FMN-containing flavoprotein (pyridoxamine 5'-phosphate oxidase superfamily)